MSKHLECDLLCLEDILLLMDLECVDQGLFGGSVGGGHCPPKPYGIWPPLKITPLYLQ